MTKVVLIGAGSTNFTPAVLSDLARCSRLKHAELALVDVDESVLATMVALGQRLARELGLELKVTGATDRREVLPGADFVVTTFAAGGAEAWREDLEIPARYGIVQSVGDSVGPGGLSRALRHIPIIVDVARDVEKLCPEALLFNYTNPMTALCRAVARTTRTRAVGLCAGPLLTRNDLATRLGLPRDELQFHGAGLNHCFWILDARWRGRDVYDLSRDLAAGGGRARRAAAALDDLLPGAGSAALEASSRYSFCSEVLSVLGYLPGPGDRHVAEFFPRFFPEGPGADSRLGLGMYAIERFISGKRQLMESLESQATGRTPLDPALVEGRVGHSEEVVDIMSAVVGDEGRLMYGNVPNHGIVANLPAETVVETRLLYGSYGYRALAVGDLPPSLLPFVAERAAQQELVVEAALTGSRQVALQALLADGCVKSVSTASRLLDDLLRAHAVLLPQF